MIFHLSLGCHFHTDGGAGSKGVKPSQRPQHSRHCGNWVRNTDGGTFSSPNYPNTYPPNKECLYVLEGNQQHAPEPDNMTAPVPIFVNVADFDIKMGQFFCELWWRLKGTKQQFFVMTKMIKDAVF